MIRLPLRSTLTDTLFRYTTLFLSIRNPRRSRGRRFPYRPLGARGAVDDEPRRDPRPRGERTGARHLDLRICRNARGVAGRRAAYRLPAWRETRHVLVGQDRTSVW